MLQLNHLVDNLRLRLFTLLRVPLIAFLRPVIVALDDERCVVRLPLNRRSRNHLRSMYMGALCVGAETTVGVIAIKQVLDKKLRVSVVQREMQAEFAARAKGDVDFTCAGVPAVQALIRQAQQTSDRVEGPIRVVATTGDQTVARFTFTLSLRSKR